MKILTVVGARPQFIKAAAVSRAVRAWNSAGKQPAIEEVIVHTGQHFDHNMSQTFFEQLAIPEPRYNLDIHGGGHGQMTGRMLEKLEATLEQEKPDWLLIYGDTNSTLAGALAAAKLHIPVAHVEAGLRSFNNRMPEEINRIVADRISTLLFCPTDTAVANLASEGRSEGVSNVGDVMYDAALFMREQAESQSAALDTLQLTAGNFVLTTCHRAENTDDPQRLRAILDGLGELAREMPVVLPLHPRTRQVIARQGLESLLQGLKIVEPLPYLDMVKLEAHAALIATDSGGVQKEAYFYRVPCVTLRDETEWVETVSIGWNRLAPPGSSDLAGLARQALAARPQAHPDCYGDGAAAQRILEQIAAATR